MANKLQKDKQKKEKKSVFGVLFLVLLGVAIFIFNNICCIAIVEGNSMYPTLKDGEMYLLNRYNYTPVPNDIVLVEVNPDMIGTAHIVKRVIAVGGDTIEIDYGENKVYVNGEPLEEPYVNVEDDDSMKVKAYQAESSFTIPEGYVFVMGDNRNHSTDSRSVLIGPVPVSTVIGKVTVRIH